nr:YegP family protein [Halomicroarcula marina]
MSRDEADDWRWRLRHANGNIVAASGEGYASKVTAKQDTGSVKSNAPAAESEIAQGRPRPPPRVRNREVTGPEG